MKITSFRINGLSVLRFSINGREVSLGQEPVLCDALCFTALEAGSTVKLHKVGSAPDVNLLTSTNGRSWTPYTVEDTITLANVNDKVYFKAVGSNTKMGNSGYSYNNFVMTGKIAASGNVNSLLEENEETARTMSLAGTDQCYRSMFYNCTSLTKAPELPATTLGSSCYEQMFEGCTSLTSTPELPATTLTEYCYLSMFNGCTSLENGPELPSMTLVHSCYNSMFKGCTSLTQAPVLPATTLVMSCYENMFAGCTSLTQAPVLPATTLAGLWCYRYMFLNCSNLNYVKVMLTNWAGDATDNWLPENVGTFECPKALIDNTTERTTSTVPSTWNMVAYDVEPVLSDALCFKAEEQGSTVKLHKNGSAPAVNLQTSTDGSSWTPYTIEDAITLTNVGDKVYFKAVGSNERMATTDSDYNNFVMTGKIAASGNVNSLLEENEETARTISLAGKAYCYSNMFKDCSSLTQAPVLPATTLAQSCYFNMFSNCTSLTQAPALPATTLADYCYLNMFWYCSSLTQAPVLPATTLADGCYNGMFYGCSSLNQAPVLPAKTLTSNCYGSMFSTCSSLTQAPALPATTLAQSCYANMFENCYALNQAPVLPATELASSCYSNMFQGCSSLTQAPVLPATTLADNCYLNMFNGCTSLTQAPVLPAKTLTSSCYYSMFYGCSSLNQAPVLPATELAYGCYAYMFNECYQLNYIKVLFTNWNDTSTTENWLPENAGTFECPQALIDNTTERTTNTIPESWNIVDVQLYLCFTALEPGSTVQLHKVGSAPDVNLQTSTDGSSWNPYNVEDTITLDNIGDKVYFKALGSNERMATTDSDYHNFVMTGKIAAYGNVNSLLLEDKETAYTMSLEGKMYCYKNMFKDCSSLTKAPNLPATTLYYNCYESMFDNCTSLTQAPELPATTLAQSCYGSMFLYCSSLAQAPALPANTSLPQSCYNGMFLYCTSLTQAPALPATELGTSSYEGMFRGCTSLTQAPEINATTASELFCYRYMFLYCSNLNYVRVALNDWGNEYTRTGWLEGVAVSGTFECPQALIDNTTERSDSTVPASWTMVAV